MAHATVPARFCPVTAPTGLHTNTEWGGGNPLQPGVGIPGRMTSVLFLGFMLAHLFGPVPALSQWEGVYGADDAEETGMHMVPVFQPCVGGLGGGTGSGGWIAVGTTDDPVTHTDIHVVRIDAAGNRLWEYTYDIGGREENDEGFDIVETPANPGFAITGRTETVSGNGWDAFILKIDCEGVVLWSATYGSTGEEAGNAIIEAYGADNQNTFLGDLVVAGYSTSTISGGSEAWMFRVDPANGFQRWSKLYRSSNQVHPTVTAGFNDVVEPRWDSIGVQLPDPPDPPSAADTIGVFLGDLVAVGWCESCDVNAPIGDRDAYTVRTNHLGYFPPVMTGGLPALQVFRGMNHWGGSALDEAFAVSDVTPAWPRSTNHIYEIVATGVVDNNAIGLIQFDRVRLLQPPLASGNVGAPGASISHKIQSPAISGVGQFDIPRDLDEVPEFTGEQNVLQGDWALTGEKAATLAQGGQDAFVLLVRNAFAAGTFVPNASQFGGAGTEQGNSITHVMASTTINKKFGVAATTTTDFMSVGDPQDMYLFNADYNLSTGCEIGYTATVQNYSPAFVLDTHSMDFLNRRAQLAPKTSVDWDDIVCGPGVPKAVRERFEHFAEPSTGSLPERAIVIRKGMQTIEMPDLDGASLYLVDPHGSIVWSTTDEESMIQHLPTGTLPAGIYRVRLAVNGVVVDSFSIIIQ